MPSPRLLIALASFAAFAVHAAATPPAVSQVLPAISGSGSSPEFRADLKQHFTLPGVDGSIVQFQTSLGTFNVELFDQSKPITTTNFLNYVNSGRFDQTFIHRSVANFVIQGGGFGYPLPVRTVVTDPPILNEPGISNLRGTVAMAKIGGNPNSATSQWFVNLGNNSANLDGQNGGFTVFGRVLGNGMNVVDAIALLPVFNAGGAFSELPVSGYTGGTITDEHLVRIPSVRRIPLYPAADEPVSALTFHLSENTNPAVASVRLEGSELVTKLTPRIGGTANITVQARDTGGQSASTTYTVTSQATVPSTAARLVNLSTRGVAGTGDNALIAGFVITGTEPLPLLLRGIGPQLAAYGVPGTLAQPRLVLFSGGTQIDANEGWETGGKGPEMAATFERLGAFPLAPGGADTALLVTLAPGSYTVHVTGRDGSTGVALAEVYDASTEPGPSRLVNISARLLAGSGDDKLIAGFVIDGDGEKHALARAIGPTLADFGVSGVLAKPRLEVFRRQTLIDANSDGWSRRFDANAIAAVSQVIGAFDLPISDDAVCLVRLGPGAYTAVAGGENGASGVTLVEIFEVD
jgi:cyclophilin family peptidyl-prolyl cis-trans isomerase